MLVVSFQIQDDFLGRVYIPFNLMDVNNRDTFPVVRVSYVYDGLGLQDSDN